MSMTKRKNSKTVSQRSSLDTFFAAAKRRAIRATSYQKRRARPIAGRMVSALKSRGIDAKAAVELAFHMTDWLYDLKELTDFYRSPGRLDAAQIERLLLGFLGHVPWHLNAAHRILWGDPVTDPFDLGAVRGSGVQKRKPGAEYPGRRFEVSKGR